MTSSSTSSRTVKNTYPSNSYSRSSYSECPQCGVPYYHGTARNADTLTSTRDGWEKTASQKPIITCLNNPQCNQIDDK
ncbi:MAG: hypothetical protein Q4Q14_05390 [Methanobrevibacter sp.]|nr:hypothetical protein [Methanobrevibacter sp.]